MSLIDTIRRLARRILGVHVVGGAAWGAVAAGVLLVVGVWLDLVWELSAGLRIGNAILAATMLPAVLVIAVALGLRRAQPDAVARRLDRVQGANGSVRAGVELALAPPSGDSMSRGLAALAIDRAGRDAASVPPAAVAPLRPIARAWGGLAAFALALAGISATAPRLVETEWLRWSDPFGDHPPYSPLVFHVDPEEIRVVYGAATDIRVRVEGGTADRLDLMLRPDGANAAESLPMFPEGPGQWRATLTSVLLPGTYWVRAGNARSVRHRLTVITVPSIEEVAYRIEPPTYANRPTYEGPLPQGGIAGLVGTKVAVRVRSNRPLKQGEILFDDGASLRLDPVADVSSTAALEVHGVFELRRSGKGRLTITDVDGQASASEIVLPMTVLPDEAPRVRIVEPPPVSLATPTANLPVTVAASDDYGLARVRLYRSLNDSRPIGGGEKMPATPPVRWSRTETLPLSAYGLAPGDVIKLQARAEDTFPGGPNTAQSATVLIKIISQEQYDRMNRSRNSIDMLFSKYQQARRQVENAKGEVERLRRKRKDKDEPAGRAALQKELERLAQRLQDSSNALDKLAKQQLPYELDELLRKELERSARQLQRLGQKSHDLAGGGGLPSAIFDSLDEIMKALEEMNDTLERETIVPLEVLAAIEPFLEQAAIIEFVHRRQKALVARLDGYKGKVEKESWRRPSIETRELQRDIRKLLAGALDKLDDLLAGLDAKALDLEVFAQDVRDFVDAVRKGGVIEAMSEAERELERSTPEPGATAARKALELLEEILKKNSPMDLDRNAGGGGAGGRPRFGPGLKNALRQTLGRMLGERGFGGQSDPSGSSDVGLYGDSDMPRTESPTAGSGNLANKAAGSGPNASNRDDGNRRTPQIGEIPSTTTPGSANEGVPNAYRRRVADYFERIAEETSPGPQKR